MDQHRPSPVAHPGNGDLFGIAMTPDNKGFYYVMDDVNTLMRGSR